MPRRLVTHRVMVRALAVRDLVSLPDMSYNGPVIESGFAYLLLVAIGLSADCFAVALSGSISKIDHPRSRILRVSLSFGLFQALMPVLGWLAGKAVVESIAAYDHWVAFGLLTLVGGRMLWESLGPERNSPREVDMTKGLLLITLSLATSIDALAVGLSFAFLDVNIAMASITIGATALAATAVAFLIGKKAGKLIGKRAEAIGSVMLIAIGIRTLLTHIL